MDFKSLSLPVDLLLLEYILAGVFLFFAIVQLCYYLLVFRRLAFHKIPDGTNQQPPVSLIICARNEIANLQQYLEQVLQQSYPKFQVIVVNDCSWDETEEYLEALQTQYPILKVVTLKEQERYKHGKKFAMALGIKAAQYEHLVMTDADCRPSGPEWLAEIMRGYQTPETEFVLGYGAYKKQSGLLNKWIRFDTAFNAMQYLSFALGGSAYMGVGRNLSYKKEVFFRNKGFANHYHIASGDDDLFVNENAKPKNVAVRLSLKSFTYSKPKTKWSEWNRQKQRHLSTSQYYRSKDKFKLGFFFFSNYLFWITAIALLVLQFYWPVVAGVLAFLVLLKWFIAGKSFQRLDERDIIWLIPFFNMFTLFIYPFLSLGGRVYKDSSWK